MENVEIKLINERFKRYKTFLFVWVAVIGLALGLAIIGIIDIKKEVKFTYLNDLILEENNNTLKNSYLNIHTEPFVFAEYDNDTSRFYIVKDSEYLYIVYLDEDLYNKIVDVEDIESNPYRVEGYTETIPDDVKALAIEAYNEAFEEEIVNEDNFDSYFGSIYLNTNGIHNNADVWYILALILGIIGVCGIYGIANANKKSKKVISSLTSQELKSIAKELEKEEVNVYAKNNLYITNTHLITLVSYIDIIKYKDIVWYYKQDVRTNGIKTSQGIIVVTKDGIKHTIIMLTYSKKDRTKFEEISNKLAEKLPKVLVGYTDENKKRAKELYGIK